MKNKTVILLASCVLLVLVASYAFATSRSNAAVIEVSFTPETISLHQQGVLQARIKGLTSVESINLYCEGNYIEPATQIKVFKKAVLSTFETEPLAEFIQAHFPHMTPQTPTHITVTIHCKLTSGEVLQASATLKIIP